MKYLLSFISLISLSFIFSTSALAVTATPSASPTTNMEEKIKLLVQENLSTTEAKLKEKANLQSLIGYVGTIKTINSTNLTIDTNGDLIQITTTSKTVLTKDGAVLKFSSLALGDKVIVIGISIKDDIIQAKRLTVTKAEPNPVKTTVSVAKISAIDLKKKTLSLLINTTENIFTLSKKSTVKLEEYQKDQTILAITKEYLGKFSISRAKAL